MELFGPALFLTILVLGAAAGAFAWWNSPLQIAKRKLRRLELTPVGQLRPGQKVKITGRVVLHDRLTAPLSQEPCAYWQVAIEEKVGKNNWRGLADAFEGAPFWVEDDSGRVWVDPGTRRLTLEKSTHASGAFDDPSPQETALLQRFGLASTGLLGFNRTLRYDEASVHEGEEVTVFGEVALRELGGEVALALIAAADDDLVVCDAIDV